MSQRKKAIEFALSYIQKIDPTGINTKILKENLESLSEAEFSKLMDVYESGEDMLSIQYPVFGPVKLDVNRNLEIGKELGHKFFHHLTISSPDPDTPSHVTPPKYLVLEIPVRRTIQLLEKGISTAKNNNRIDPRTGTVTGDSATSKISFPEQGVLSGMGMDNTIKELASVRGGDIGAHGAMEALMMRDGQASIAQLEAYATGPESVRSYGSLLTSMHIRNNL